MIDTVAITSAHSGNAYNLYVYEGVARGCTCKFRQHNHTKPCRHMKEFNTKPQYEGCDFCGRNHKSWNCPF